MGEVGPEEPAPRRSGGCADTEQPVRLGRAPGTAWRDAEGRWWKPQRFHAPEPGQALPPGWAARPIAWLRLDSIDPSQVHRLTILRDDAVVYDITGFADRQGRFVPAGTLIESMAWLERTRGLSIATRNLQLHLPDTTVELLAADADAAALAGVSALLAA